MKFGNNATINDFLQKVKEAYLCNNHVYSVAVELRDGQKPLRIVYVTPQGFESDQTQRRGDIDLSLD